MQEKIGKRQKYTLGEIHCRHFLIFSILMNDHFQAKIIKLTKEVDNAVARNEQLKLEKEQEKQEIIAGKLKSKGDKLLQLTEN